MHARLFVVHGGCVFLVSGVTSAGDLVKEVEELHVSVTEGVTEWGVVSEVDMGMVGNMTWAPGLCPEDRCSMDEYSSKKSLSCQTSNFVNPYLTNFVLEHYLH